MATIIIYNSKTGFTEKYAMWLKDALGAECCALKDAKKIDFGRYDAVVFGSWSCAGSVSKQKWLMDRLPGFKNKKVAFYFVGGSPRENPDIDKYLETAIPAGYPNAKAFYCQGGFDYERMSVASRAAMKMFVRMLKSKKDATEDEKKMAEMVSKSYDITDRKFIEPIVDFIQGK